MCPGPVGERPSEGERKKFCMSITSRAVEEGDRVIGEVVVRRVRRGLRGTCWEGDGVDGGRERVRSKPVMDECRQKEEGVPIWALR